MSDYTIYFFIKPDDVPNYTANVRYYYSLYGRTY